MEKTYVKKECSKLTISISPELKVWHQSAETPPKGCIIFVHGICHGAWCFKRFMAFFSENGYECFALNLRGHSENDRSDLKGARLLDYADDVAQCVTYCARYCRENGIDEKPLLLGHSMGGAVVQKYAAKFSDTTKGLILFASATAPRMPRLNTFFSLTKKKMRIAAKKSWGCKTSDAEIAQSAFFDGRITSQEEISMYNTLLHEESFWITFQDLYLPYAKKNKISTPILIIGSYADSYFSGKSLWKTASFYGCREKRNKRSASRIDLTFNERNQLTILPDLCHDMMLDPEWEKPAKAVLDFMEKNK